MTKSTNRDFADEMQFLEWELQTAKQKKEIADKKREIRQVRWGFKKPETSKILTVFLLTNFTVIEVFSMVAMWHFGNLDALYSLITTICAETVTLASYFAKAYHGKKQEELVKLERDKMQSEPTAENEEEALG